jgi:hypothetical protein
VGERSSSARIAKEDPAVEVDYFCNRVNSRDESLSMQNWFNNVFDSLNRSWKRFRIINDMCKSRGRSNREALRDRVLWEFMRARRRPPRPGNLQSKEELSLVTLGILLLRGGFVPRVGSVKPRFECGVGCIEVLFLAQT